jgi:serine protease
VLRHNRSCPYSEIVNGLQWVVSQVATSSRKAVINLSLGGPVSTIVNDAVDAAVSAGIAVVVSAGNSAADACNFSPASAASAITVAASTSSDSAALFSNQGACIDIYAPGLSVTSAGAATDSDVTVVSGTTIAAPLVAGVAARLLGELPTLSPAQLWSLMTCLSSNNVLTSVPSGTVNRLLYSEL